MLLHGPKGDGMGGLASQRQLMFSSASSAGNTEPADMDLPCFVLSLAVILSAGWLN